MEHAEAVHLPGIEPGVRLVCVTVEGGSAQQEVEAVLVVAHLWGEGSGAANAVREAGNMSLLQGAASRKSGKAQQAGVRMRVGD